ncbi:MAG: hypothetical protein GXP55_01140 [Deltaproteobacteria bacterium]|nr:hypothetical protein [Deltaproteobacteria bacterium]
MSRLDANALEAALTEAELEIYQKIGTDILLAERVRLHMMDSGVRLRVESGCEVRFTTRCQRSDFPSDDEAALYARVREATGPLAQAQGFREVGAERVQVTDPMDASKLLDTWHEITWARAVTDTQQAVELARWALTVEKYVAS